MATNLQNQEFANEIFPSDPLDAAIEWIASNMTPDDVFVATVLENWATDNGFVANDNLDQWALDNGYTKE